MVLRKTAKPCCTFPTWFYHNESSTNLPYNLKQSYLFLLQTLYEQQNSRKPTKQRTPEPLAKWGFDQKRSIQRKRKQPPPHKSTNHKTQIYPKRKKNKKKKKTIARSDDQKAWLGDWNVTYLNLKASWNKIARERGRRKNGSKET